MSIEADKLARAVKTKLQRDSAVAAGHEVRGVSEEDVAILDGFWLGKRMIGVENFSEIGLSEAKAEEHRILYGSNEIDLPEEASYMELLKDSLEDPTLRILLVSALVSLFLGFSRSKDSSSGIEGLSVLLSVAVVVNVQAMTNYNKAREFRKQQEELENRKSVSVVRGGQLTALHPRHLVVGDIFRAKVGTVIPADGILVSGELWMDESSLTGESHLLQKAINSITVSGTNVMRGEGFILSVAVGRRSISGTILTAIFDEHSEAGESVLFKKLDRLAVEIGKVGMGCALFVFLALLGTWTFSCREPPDSTICHPTTWEEKLSTVLEFFITAVTVLVVAVPEGLPLAVTLALAVALGRLLKDRNQVKRFESCETMGSATTICSDKTGTLTENKMKVVNQSPSLTVSEVSRDLFIKCCALAVSPDSKITTKILPSSSSPDFNYEGNPTECALLRHCMTKMNVDYEKIQKDNFDPESNGQRWGSQLNPFSSEKKMMSIVIKKGSGNYFMLAKGAPAVLLQRSTSYFNPVSGIIEPLTDRSRDLICAEFNQEEVLARRVLGFAVKLDQKNKKIMDEELTFLGWISLEDPLRDHIVQSVSACRRAGVTVRMITGDSMATARAIALQCGILSKEDEASKFAVMTGAEFEERVHKKDFAGEKILRRGFDFQKNQDVMRPAEPFVVTNSGKRVLDEEVFDEIWPQLRVLARCEPEDKLTLVKGLRGSKLHLRDPSVQAQVVAVTGDGTNDAPSLKAADIGFAMGIAGTDVAKQAADVIVLDDSFNSIVRALVWGRNVHDSVCKFIQFQMTVNLSAVILTSIGSLFLMKSPMNSTQMLWVNMIMDSLGSLALATMKPDEESLLSRPPIPKHQSVISLRMAVNTIGQSILQLAYLFHFLFSESVRSGKFYTIFFNTFVMFQLINEINCKTVSGKNSERFLNYSDWQFAAVWLSTVVIQFVIVQYLGVIFNCVPLNFHDWLTCIAVGLTSFPWQIIIVDPVAGFLEERFSLPESVDDGDDDTKSTSDERANVTAAASLELGLERGETSSLLRRGNGVTPNYNSLSNGGEVELTLLTSARANAKRRWALVRNVFKFSNAVTEAVSDGGSQTSRESRTSRADSVTSHREPIVSRVIRGLSNRSLRSSSADDHSDI